MSKLLDNRVEMVFLYDVKDGNPNGDPMDENKPRIDEETGQNIVTDVRLKRTIRDYLAAKGMEVFVSGEAVTSEQRVAQLAEKATDKDSIKKTILEKCIDVRLFGGTIPTKLKGRGAAGEDKSKGEGISLTGPVQFRMGRSLHKVKLQHLKGTAAFTAKEGLEQRSFREEWLLPYSLIAFYGVVNQHAARETAMTVGDMGLLTEAIWLGTKNLITRSKMEQNPRLLVQVFYKSGDNLHLGELDAYIKACSTKPDQEIRDIADVRLDITELGRALSSKGARIEKVRVARDPRCTLVDDSRSAVELKAFFQRWGLDGQFDEMRPETWAQ